MNNLIKYSIVFVLILITACSMTYADSEGGYSDEEVEFVGTDVDQEYAIKLSKIGVFQGSEKGYELNRQPTRLEGLVMLIRLLGQGKNVENLDVTTHPFIDVPSWGNAYVSYAYSNGLTNGINNLEFGSKDYISVNSYATFMLRTLGYSDKVGDFSYHTALKTMYEKKIIKEDQYQRLLNQTFTRGDLARISYQVLNAPMNDASKSLGEHLIVTNNLSQESALLIGLIDEPILKNKRDTMDLINSHRGSEKLNIKLEETKITINAELLDDSINHLWIRINDDTDSSVFDENIKKSNDRFNLQKTINLSDGVYNVTVYKGEKRYGHYDSWVLNVPLYVTNKELYFYEPLVYKKNYREYHFNTLQNSLKELTQATISIESENEEIIALALEITRGIDDPYLKVKAIHDWVADNIYYNYDGYYSGEYGTVNATNVLKNKYAVCSGYANLTAALIRSVDIPCKVVVGHGLGLSTKGIWTEENINSKTNHAWNEAYIDNRWVIIDTTWNSSNRYENNTFDYKGINGYRYFDPTLETFSFTHRIN